MKPEHRTRWLVVVTLIVWGVWDAWVWLTGRETISAVFGVAFSWPWLGWWVAGTYGFLTGHIAGMMDLNTELYWWRVLTMMVPFVIGFWLTYRS